MQKTVSILILCNLFLLTYLSASQDEALSKIVIDTKPMGRAGEYEEIAIRVLFLVSYQAASYVTGSELISDGGSTAQ